MKKNPSKKSPTIVGKKKPGFWVFTSVVLFLTALVFLPSLWNGSTNFDDPQYVFENPDVHKNNIKAFWTEAYVGTYLPLTMMTYGVEYQLAGDNPQLYHFTNLFLHLINTLLVCLLMHFLIGRIEFVVIVGLLFGIHPQHVESVAWICLLYTSPSPRD